MYTTSQLGAFVRLLNIFAFQSSLQGPLGTLKRVHMSGEVWLEAIEIIHVV